MSGRANYAYTCPVTGKRAFLNRALAKATIRRLGTGNGLKTYRCDHCGLWHVGHGHSTPRTELRKRQTR